MKLNPGDTIVSEVKLDINKTYLQKNDLALLARMAANKWKRPIYVTSTAELRNLGLEKYVRMEGLTYRIVPVENSQVETDVAYKNVMEKFVYGGANRRALISMKKTVAISTASVKRMQCSARSWLYTAEKIRPKGAEQIRSEC